MVLTHFFLIINIVVAYQIIKGCHWKVRVGRLECDWWVLQNGVGLNDYISFHEKTTKKYNIKGYVPIFFF